MLLESDRNVHYLVVAPKLLCPYQIYSRFYSNCRSLVTRAVYIMLANWSNLVLLQTFFIKHVLVVIMFTY